MGASKPVKRSKTARAIGERLGVSARTVRRYMAQPRADYEGQSLTRSKPWAAFDVSRTTWYRLKAIKGWGVSHSHAGSQSPPQPPTLRAGGDEVGKRQGDSRHPLTPVMH